MAELQGTKVNIVVKHKQRQDGDKDVQIKDFKPYERPATSATGDEIPF